MSTSAMIVEYAVNWFLGDVATWEQIRRNWVREVKDRNGKVETIPIEPNLHRNGREWKKTFDIVYARFRHRLLAVVGDADAARWTSYGLSYQALRGSAKLRRYDQHPYIFKACVNAHKKFLGRAESWGRQQWES